MARAIEVLDEPFQGYQMRTGYRYRATEDEEGEPVTRMQPRALMAPPGIPDFFTRERTVRLGPVELEGRAWSGFAPIAGVEVSPDGETWHEAARRARPGRPVGLVPLALDVGARRPGEYELRCRARDETGNVQPDEPPWNLGGYANNGVQRVRVAVV